MGLTKVGGILNSKGGSSANSEPVGEAPTVKDVGDGSYYLHYDVRYPVARSLRVALEGVEVTWIAK